MSARRLFAAAALLVAVALLADEKLAMSFGEYKQLRRKATSREAYQRALERLARVKVGMRSDEFFEVMEMLMIKDDSGRPLDGFVEGYLQAESLERNDTESAGPRLLVFGYHENWKRHKQPVRKFTVVFEHQQVKAIEFVDVSEDPRRKPTEAAR